MIEELYISTGIKKLIDLALSEDIGTGDVTVRACIDPSQTGQGKIMAKEPQVAAGLSVARAVFLRIDSGIEFINKVNDGDEVVPGQCMARVKGNMVSILLGERTALNFLQRLSGIATLSREYAGLAAGTHAAVVDTRKTTPGFRVLEKYAVRVGGAKNHRMGLYDGILIKDNHIKACGGVKKAIDRARESAHHLLAVEVEVSNFEELDEAVAARADVIMLDNMDDSQVQKAVEITGGRALVEVSGSITKKRIPGLAAMGVDIISVGALTHSACAVDISMKVV